MDEDMHDISMDSKVERTKRKRKKRLLMEEAKARRRGVCYLSRIPPRMDHIRLRQILSQYGDIDRIYLSPENPAAQMNRKRAGWFRGKGFSEGWVEFTEKTIAKRVASMLNGEAIGGKKRSQFYYDLWNIKYLTKFKWDNLTDETAQKNADREEKLNLELTAAKKEKDFYISRVEKSRDLAFMAERLKKEQKIPQHPKVIRQFRQTQPVADKEDIMEPGLSKDILAKVFGGS